MIKKIILFSFVFILNGCSLNADQERSLNHHLSRYLDARTSCKPIIHAGYTHPDLVRYLKNMSTDTLKSFFKCDEQQVNLFNPTILEVKKNKNTIHVRYELDQNMNNEMSKSFLIAVTDDVGKTWFFIDEKFYVDKSILNKEKRLLKK